MAGLELLTAVERTIFISCDAVIDFLQFVIIEQSHIGSQMSNEGFHGLFSIELICLSLCQLCQPINPLIYLPSFIF